MNSPAERGVTTITTTPQQALSGTEIGPGPIAQCSMCARSIGEGSDAVLDYAGGDEDEDHEAFAGP